MKKVLLFIVMLISVSVYAETTTYNTDVVIVGAGGSGNAAAIQAAQLGAKVIVLEKEPAAGGNANFCEGIFAADSKIQKAENLPDVSKEYLFDKIMDFNHYKGDPRIVSAFVNQSADTIDWLQSLGVKIDGVYLEANSRTNTWHRFTGLCRQMTQTLINQYPKFGINLMLETKATDVIMKDGNVVGVKAVNADGDNIVVNAKAVIIGTGGFINNAEMLKKYASYKGPIRAIGAKERTGDGINMALEAGAQTDGIGTVQLHSPGPIMSKGQAGGTASMFTRKTTSAFNQPLLWINSFGQRFMNEEINKDFSLAGNAATRQKNGLVIKLLDASAINYYETEGLDMFGGVHARVPQTNLRSDVEADAKDGNIVKADTIKELVQKMNEKFGTNIDLKTFEQTVAQVNHAADVNYDDLMHKPMEYLRHFNTAPYFAMATYPSALGTVGGIKINENCQAIDNNFNVIPGLYVVGADAGGLYGDTYDIVVAGETIGWAINSGRLAAKNAVATYVK